MAGLDDFFEELQKSKKPQPKPMWGEADPAQFGGGGGGLMGIIGKVAQIGGAAATLAGLPMVGIPLAVGGGALSGGAKGGITGALKGGAISGATAAAGQGLGAAVGGLGGAGLEPGTESLKNVAATKGMDVASQEPIARLSDQFAGGATQPGLTESGLGGYSIPASPNTFSSMGVPMTPPKNLFGIGGGGGIWDAIKSLFGGR